MGSEKFREEEIKFLQDQAARASSALRNMEEANKSLLARIEFLEDDHRKVCIKQVDIGTYLIA